MRTSKSIRNVIVAFISNFLSILISFIAQIFFVRFLGKELLGLNGLFTNIVSMLGIVELGLGNALIYHLYEPVSKNDYSTIKALMNFYKKSYHFISILILFLGFLLLPFLNFFVNTNLDINIYVIFILFVIESSSTYLLSYKRSILYAYQENYIVNLIKIIYILGLNIFQILLLYVTNSYLIYLVLKIVFRFFENFLITLYANKHYRFINEKDAKPLSNNVKQDIFKKIKGLFFHQIGTYIVLGTDNIIISKFIGLVVVGIYSNYVLLMNGIKSLFSQVFYSITSSVGNLLVENNKEKSYLVYKRLNYGNFWLAVFCSISFFIISKTFIILWLGEEFVLYNSIVFMLMVQLYMDIYGYTIGTFKNAAGIYHEDRFVPLMQSIINIIFSIILVIQFGLIGVVMGTIISCLLLYLYSYPRFIYTKIFNKTYIDYFKELFKNSIVFSICFIVTYFIYSNISFNVTIIQFVYALLCCLIIPNFILFIITRKSKEFCYFKDLFFKKIMKKNC